MVSACILTPLYLDALLALQILRALHSPCGCLEYFTHSIDAVLTLQILLGLCKCLGHYTYSADTQGPAPNITDVNARLEPLLDSHNQQRASFPENHNAIQNMSSTWF